MSAAPGVSEVKIAEPIPGVYPMDPQLILDIYRLYSVIRCGDIPLMVGSSGTVRPLLMNVRLSSC